MQPVNLQVTGAVQVNPVGSSPGLALFDTLRLFVQATYQTAFAGRPTIQAPDSAPASIDFQGITRCRFLVIRVAGQSMKFFITSTRGGANQVIPTSDLLLIHAPNVGDEITAVSVSGSGQINYIIAGDV